MIKIKEGILRKSARIPRAKRLFLPNACRIDLLVRYRKNKASNKKGRIHLLDRIGIGLTKGITPLSSFKVSNSACGFQAILLNYFFNLFLIRLYFKRDFLTLNNLILRLIGIKIGKKDGSDRRDFRVNRF